MTQLNVVELRKPATVTADPKIVKACRELLELAEAGQLTDLSIAVIKSNGDTATNFIANRNRFSMLGAIEWLRTRLIDEIKAGD